MYLSRRDLLIKLKIEAIEDETYILFCYNIYE